MPLEESAQGLWEHECLNFDRERAGPWEVIVEGSTEEVTL